ncbi:MAG: FHA domain-containing protein [Anaerolineae bacterium]|nr:FHA domain-containing protein [Anaerolineae bacterium]
MVQAILQIIDPRGQLEIYQIELGHTIYIGKDASYNDIPIDGPNIAIHHLVLDFRQIPCRVMSLSHLGTPTLNGHHLTPNIHHDISDAAVIRLANYQLRLLLSTPLMQHPPTTRPELSHNDRLLVPASPQLPQSLDYFEVKFPDYPDTYPALEVIPGQAKVKLRVNITNRGRYPADFTVKISDDIPHEWYESPGSCGLNPGDTKTVTLTFKADKQPDYTAGPHHFWLQVKSSEFPPDNRVRNYEATLTIKPYYEIIVGKVQPTQRAISWFRGQGKFKLTIENRGNATARFQLEGHDTENGCHYEFKRLDRSKLITLDLPGQVASGDKAEIAVWIKPFTYSLLWRSRSYTFTTLITPLEEQQAQKTLSGRLIQKPLIGPLTLCLLACLLLFACAAFIFDPAHYILRFTVNRAVNTVGAKAGEELAVEWWTSPLVTSIRLQPGNELIVGEAIGRRIMNPNSSTTAYSLEAESFASVLLPELRATRVVSVAITPMIPRINDFSVSNHNIVEGEAVTLISKVENAEEVYVTVNGTPEPPFATAEHADRRIEVLPSGNTVYGLVARHGEVAITAETTVVVATPTPTPTSTPMAELFETSGDQVMAGEPVTFKWAVSGNDKVVLDPLGELPSSGSISVWPQETTRYTLQSVNAQGTATILGMKEVVVNNPTSTPTATATPAAPKIVEFKASEDEMSLGEGETEVITLYWTVEGQTTDIQLLNKHGVALQTNLPAVSQTEVLVSDTDNQFILAVYNGNQQFSQSVFIQAEPFISYFTATVYSDDDLIKICSTSEEDDDEVCDVSNEEAAIKIIFEWEIRNADKVDLIIDDGDKQSYGQGLKDDFVKDNVRSAKYTLIAKNDVGEIKRRIRIKGND